MRSARPDRMFGVAISGGDFRKCMQTVPSLDGVDMLARGRWRWLPGPPGSSALTRCSPILDDEEGFRAEVLQNKAMGFDGKTSSIRGRSASSTRYSHPRRRRSARPRRSSGPTGSSPPPVRAYSPWDGKMIDVAFIPGAERTLKLARACGSVRGDLV